MYFTPSAKILLLMCCLPLCVGWTGNGNADVQWVAKQDGRLREGHSAARVEGLELGDRQMIYVFYERPGLSGDRGPVSSQITVEVDLDLLSEGTVELSAEDEISFMERAGNTYNHAEITEGAITLHTQNAPTTLSLELGGHDSDGQWRYVEVTGLLEACCDLRDQPEPRPDPEDDVPRGGGSVTVSEPYESSGCDGGEGWDEPAPESDYESGGCDDSDWDSGDDGDDEGDDGGSLSDSGGYDEGSDGAGCEGDDWSSSDGSDDSSAGCEGDDWDADSDSDSGADTGCVPEAEASTGSSTGRRGKSRWIKRLVGWIPWACVFLSFPLMRRRRRYRF